ncbi:MAG TPA: HGxxPAAW family protein [Dermatophilaceae bacterium]|nr:HGxxPAAW family protein [Dermatophilaceae bacterium]
MSDSHGNTPGRWTGTVVISLAGLLICFGIVLGNPPLWILGIVVAVVGTVLWNVMEKSAAKKSAGHH